MRSILFAAFLCLLAMPVLAADQNLKDRQAVEAYLQNLDTARARFVMTTHDGGQSVGTFYLDRPGKMRFEYDPPVEDFVVADGVLIYFYDAELGEQTHAPIGHTLADFFLREDIDLNDDVVVQSIKRAGDLLLIELVQESDPTAGSITLGFEENPMALKKWRVIDAQGLITEVELFYMKTDVTHSSGLFAYLDPERGTERYND